MLHLMTQWFTKGCNIDTDRPDHEELRSELLSDLSENAIAVVRCKPNSFFGSGTIIETSTGWFHAERFFAKDTPLVKFTYINKSRNGKYEFFMNRSSVIDIARKLHTFEKAR